MLDYNICFKYYVKQSASHFFVYYVQKEQINGTVPENIHLPTKLGSLCNATPRAEIEGSGPLHAPSELHLEESDEDVPVGLSTLVVTGTAKQRCKP